MNKPHFVMGQTKQEDFAAASASSATRPLNFAAQNFSFHTNKSTNNITSQSPQKIRSPPKDQPGRPSTPFPENEVQFVQNFNSSAPDQAQGGFPHSMSGNGEGTFPSSNSMGAASLSNQSNVPFQGNSSLCEQPSYLMQQQSWPPRNEKTYFSHSLDLSDSGMHRTNPFAMGQRAASCDSTQSHVTSTSPVEKEERIPNSAVRRSRVWKYGRRSSGNHSDRQPFTFSVAASQAGATSGMDPRGARFFGKRAFSNTNSDESWSSEPSHKQFISEERMTAEMHNLSIDGFPRQPLFPLSSSSSSSSSSSTASSPPHSSNHPSTSGTCSHSDSPSNLLRHHRCHHTPRTYAHRPTLADIERRLEDDDSDDEGVEEDMPPSQVEGQRLEMTPQLVSALKAKGASSHVLPQDIVKKIATSPCMELVLWRPPSSILNPRMCQDALGTSSPSSPPSSGSELAPIMEVEVERERAEANSMPRRTLYSRVSSADGMQEETLPDFDEDMDL